jgi:hypothetical protein
VLRAVSSGYKPEGKLEVDEHGREGRWWAAPDEHFNHHGHDDVMIVKEQQQPRAASKSLPNGVLEEHFSKQLAAAYW